MKFLPVLVGALAIALMTPITARTSNETALAAAKHRLHAKITTHRIATWRFQDRMHRPRSEWKRRDHSAALPLLRRLAHYWEHRHYLAWKAWRATLALAHRQQIASSAPAVGFGVWDALAACESGGDWGYNGSSGFDGGLQFLPSTWSANRLPGYPAFAYDASREQQIAVAEVVLSNSGWAAWPACSARLGL